MQFVRLKQNFLRLCLKGQFADINTRAARINCIDDIQNSAGIHDRYTLANHLQCLLMSLDDIDGRSVHQFAPENRDNDAAIPVQSSYRWNHLFGQSLLLNVGSKVLCGFRHVIVSCQLGESITGSHYYRLQSLLAVLKRRN